MEPSHSSTVKAVVGEPSTEQTEHTLWDARDQKSSAWSLTVLTFEPSGPIPPLLTPILFHSHHFILF